MARSTDQDVSRLEAFSDGVFGVAITLLAVDINLNSALEVAPARNLFMRWRAPGRPI